MLKVSGGDFLVEELGQFKKRNCKKAANRSLTHGEH